MNIKKSIAESIGYEIDGVNFEDVIIESISPDKGDYSLPCFSFAKVLRKSPTQIAEEIKASVKQNPVIEKIELVAGYVNFFLNKTEVSKEILSNFSVENFKTNQGEGKVVCVDYGSPNLAKYLHIGHFKNLIVGESLCRMFEFYGYTVKRLNFIGDYGTPFGKIIGGIRLFGSMEDVTKRGNDALQEYYVKFNQLEAEDEKYSQMARDIFKKIEEKDKEIYPIYEKVIEIGLDEAKKIFQSLGIKFDDYRGEMFYNQFVPNTLELLSKHNLLVDSQGAKIVDLSAFDMAPSVIVKSDGTSLYASRDLSAVIEREKEYKFDKMIYVTAIEQILHFKQWFKIVELLGFDYYNKLEHIPYGRFSLPEGKISSRKGKQAVFVDLLNFAHQKAEEVIENRKFEIESPEHVADVVAKAVLSFNVLKVERAKDCVFDTEKAFSFDGETAPYMLYTLTRLSSILRKANINCHADYTCLNQEAFELVKGINNFDETIASAFQKRDSSLILKKCMELCKQFNKFYTTTKILTDDEPASMAKLNLVKALKNTLSLGFALTCIDTLEEM